MSEHSYVHAYIRFCICACVRDQLRAYRCQPKACLRCLIPQQRTHCAAVERPVPAHRHCSNETQWPRAVECDCPAALPGRVICQYGALLQACPRSTDHRDCAAVHGGVASSVETRSGDRCRVPNMDGTASLHRSVAEKRTVDHQQPRSCRRCERATASCDVAGEPRGRHREHHVAIHLQVMCK